MLAHDPDIARARYWNFANLRYRVLIGLTLVVRLFARDKFGQRVGVEAGDVQIETFQLQSLKFDPQHRVIPASVLRDAVVCDDQGAALGRAQVIQYDHGHDFQPEFLRSGQAAMPSDDDAVTACKDRIGEAKLGNRCGDLRHLIIRVRPRIAGIGQQFGCRPLLDLVGQPVHAATSISRSVAISSKDWPVAMSVTGTPGWFC